VYHKLVTQAVSIFVMLYLLVVVVNVSLHMLCYTSILVCALCTTSSPNSVGSMQVMLQSMCSTCGFTRNHTIKINTSTKCRMALN
jgi:predicted Zn-ribbon and HTH transcriptional regulator